MTADKRLNYGNKVMLAPMVRVGTLPMRLLALEMGADIVYTEELIDKKLVRSKRRINDALKTVDFIDPLDGTIIFRTCSMEKEKLVLQIGTNDAARAVAVGKMVENDISGLDVNMGCPKDFSIKGGMGIALLNDTEKAADILKKLCESLHIPVTCKIRILPSLEDTITLVQKLAATGIAAIAIHARTKDERPQHSPHPDFIREIVKVIDIPVIANGGSREILSYSHIRRYQELCGAHSVMVGRAAQFNASIFRHDGLLSMDDMICRYLKLSVDFDNPPHNTKYCIQGMLKKQQETPLGKRFLACQTMEQMCKLWNLELYCKETQLELKRKGYSGRCDVIPGCIIDNNVGENEYYMDAKRCKFETILNDVIERNAPFLRSNYEFKNSPKAALYIYACKNLKAVPCYETFQEDKLFRAVCLFDGKRYSSSFWEKNKKQAEQGAAIVCLLEIGAFKQAELDASVEVN